MANRNNRMQMGGRRMDLNRKNFNNRPTVPVSPWQAGGPGLSIGNVAPMASHSTEATLVLANNLINNLLQTRQNAVPSLLDMPMRRQFGGEIDMRPRFEPGFNRMGPGPQGNFRRPPSGYNNRGGERMNNNRRPFRPSDGPRNRPNQSNQKKDADKPKPKAESKESQAKAEIKEESKDANVESAAEGDAPAAEGAKADEKATKTYVPPKTPYDDINSQLLFCHICNKSMWDGRSFENHLNGRAHFIMMQKTAESYALTADTMRQELKIREMKRTRKPGFQRGPRDFFCAMCDLYASDGPGHRTTVGHRKLKKYLHPSCQQCHKEMPTRIELDEHRLTAEHLHQLQDSKKDLGKNKPEVMVISTLEMEQSYVRTDHRGRGKSDNNTAEDANKTSDSVKVETSEGDTTAKTEEGDVEMDKTVDDEDTILDYQEGDDLTGLTQEMIPTYTTERGVGRSFISEFTCQQCKLCKKLLDTPETAEVHLKTWKHHQLFVKLIRGKLDKETPTDGAKRSAEASEDEDGENGCKRRKTQPEPMEQETEPAANGDEKPDEQNGDAADEDEEMKEEEWETDLTDILKDVKNDQSESAAELASNEVEPEETAVETPAAKVTPAPVETPAPEESPAPKATPAKASPKATPRGGRARRGRRI